MGQLFSISSIDGAVSSIPTSEEGSHGTSSREHKTAIGPGTTHSSKDLQDVGVIRTKPENLTSKKGTEEGEKVTITSNYFAIIDDLDEYAVGHLLKFLTADDVMALGQTSSKWLVICGPLMKKKALETWSNTGHIPSAAEVATVELLVAHDLLSSQIFTRKVGSVIASSLPKLVSAAALAAPGVI